MSLVYMYVCVVCRESFTVYQFREYHYLKSKSHYTYINVWGLYSSATKITHHIQYIGVVFKLGSEIRMQILFHIQERVFVLIQFIKSKHLKNNTPKSFYQLGFYLINHLFNLSHKADLYQITHSVQLEPLSYITSIVLHILYYITTLWCKNVFTMNCH